MIEELNYFLGLQIKQLHDGFFINQSKYIGDIFKNVGIENARPCSTPMSTTTKITKDEMVKPVYIKLYRGRIIFLIYLTASRPYIMYSICLCARFQACPKESHLSSVRHIFRYLFETRNVSLWYPKCDMFDLVSYFDVDYAGCQLDRKSTSETCQFLGYASSFSKKAKLCFAIYCQI